MTISFPTSLDVLLNPAPTDLVENATLALDHDQQHANANDAIEALEAKVGANSSAVTTSHDYKLSGVTGSDKATSLTGAESLSSKTLPSPKITTAILDTNGNTLVNIGATGSAVNYVKVTNAITGTAGPTLSADGETNVDLKIAGKGTGKVHNTTGRYGDIAAYSPSAAGTATLTLNTSNVHTISMPAGNITIALSNESVGQAFIVNIIQDSVGSRTVTWFTTIKWPGAVAPTLITTANKIDSFGFLVSSAGNYYGYTLGQGL